MSRIRETFASLKRAGCGGFIPFITAGDPDLTTTELLLIELAAAGADIIDWAFLSVIPSPMAKLFSAHLNARWAKA